eukprot:403245-Heterocapsa_arctica.AAC.2
MGLGGGWRRVFINNSTEPDFVAIFLSEAYYLAQARRWDNISPKQNPTEHMWTNTATFIITIFWNNWEPRNAYTT